MSCPSDSSHFEHWHSLLLLCSEIRSDDQSVHGKIDNKRSHSGIENCAGQQLVRQVDGEEIGLAGSVQPAKEERTEISRENLDRHSKKVPVSNMGFGRRH